MSSHEKALPLKRKGICPLILNFLVLLLMIPLAFVTCSDDDDDCYLPPTHTPTTTGEPTPTITPDMTPTVTPSPNPTPTPATIPDQPGDIWYVDTIIGPMRFVPATESAGFEQGAPLTEVCRDHFETPFHHVLTRNLAVSETEITRAMWLNLQELFPQLPDDPSDTTISPGSNHPVQQISWSSAILSANLLSQVNGLEKCYYTDSSLTTAIDHTNYLAGNYYCDFSKPGYRLPTEGEWEYLARAGTETAFSCSEPYYLTTTCASCLPAIQTRLESHAVFCPNSMGQTLPAGSKNSNPWNLSDVHGNVYEWCWDWDTDYPMGKQTDYTGPTTGAERVVRGGSWISSAWSCRSAYRHAFPPQTGYPTVGFRLVRAPH